MTKHAINAFLATSVYICQRDRLPLPSCRCGRQGGRRGLKTESRIGPGAYLSPERHSPADARPRHCVPERDRRRETPRNPPALLGEVEQRSAQAMAHSEAASAVSRSFPMRVAVWGLTTSRVPIRCVVRRRSNCANWLVAHGAQVCVHDPAITELPKELGLKLTLADDPIAPLTARRRLSFPPPGQTTKALWPTPSSRQRRDHHFGRGPFLGQPRHGWPVEIHSGGNARVN